MANYTDNYNLVKPTMAETADIRTINGNMDTVDQIMHDTQISMADAFDANKQGGYAIRDLVMYEFKLYQCIHPHTGPWDAENWVRVNAAETGGNYIEITPTYQSGLKIADTDIDGDQDEINVPYFGGATAQQNGTGGAVPAPTSSDVGKFLSSNGGWETPSGGGGGTTVVPNPVGEPTDELETVQIGNTIFSIPGSGGGAGKGYETTLIYDSGSNTAGAPTGQDVSLLDNLSKYDMGVVILSTPDDRAVAQYQSSGQLFFDASYVLVDDNYHQLHWAGYGNRWIQIKFTDTTFRITGSGGEDGGHTPNVYKIYGINCGGGSGNTAEIIPITAGDDTASRTFTFSKTPKFIKFYWGDPVISGGWASDAELVWGQPYMNYRSKPMGATISQVDGGINSISYGADGKSLTITGGNAFGAFNTSNGSGLMFVDYGDRGASGGYSETDLFVNSGSTNPSTIVMADSIQNYDEIVFFVTRNAYGNTYKLQFRYTTSGLTLGDVIQCWCWGPNNEYFSYELTDYDTLDNMAQGNALLCTKIIGIKH